LSLLRRALVVTVVGALLLPAGSWAQTGAKSDSKTSAARVKTTTNAAGEVTSSRVDEIGISRRVTPKANLPDIEDEVMCPVCGTLLALATESPQANRERDLIRDLIAQGLTKDQVKDRLVEEFGSEVLATPSTSGFDITAWLVPGIAVIAAAIAIFVGLRRWRRETDQRDDAAPKPADMSDEDSKRLDADLGKYDY
jgi:cytochrome c-type biogenesis protein CcmH